MNQEFPVEVNAENMQSLKFSLLHLLKLTFFSLCVCIVYIIRVMASCICEYILIRIATTAMVQSCDWIDIG